MPQYLSWGVFAIGLVLQILNSADHYELNWKFGLRPRSVQGLLDFVSSGFLHLSWNHFEGNALYLLVVGFFAAYQGIGKLLAVTAAVLVTSSLSWWIFGPIGTYSVGASGIICGWIGYGLVGGLYHRKELGRDFVQLLAALYAVAAWQYFWPPWPASTDWRAHVGGVLGGIVRTLVAELQMSACFEAVVKPIHQDPGNPLESNAQDSPDPSPRPEKAPPRLTSQNAATTRTRRTGSNKFLRERTTSATPTEPQLRSPPRPARSVF